ncbi:LysR family transcriptional regulator [Rhodoplanes sp. TEM]|uniref:LysR family transcriptional regulator n=1 Tax=Rhodoplanes tepidamans TaxID=200616 RepID=A0ABT5J7I5_RHOTP|nr:MULTISPECIES: LysR family transcriptional regulator [Rhodoplanes]MDC7785543.1 LysR family transcriptional regulator [Rhodoplanes tepidamans]MDC7986175.1 LysR family transcriptional regulator [Rhodoplanes sp. TEM]MDQ0353287.1 DNA-binding transcriptional LysR family regulator [Rhodoplanes tepidamans]
MSLDLTDLRLFVAVAERGSITAGAAAVHLALASASARVRALEQTLGTALLERGRRGVQPTAAGEALLGHARLVLAQVASLKGDLAAHARGLAGRVRLVSNTVALAEMLPPVLAPWLARNPAVALDVAERPSPEIVGDVMAGRAEIGLAADSVDLGALERFPFAVDRLVLVVARRHRLARIRRIAFAEAAAEPFVALAGDSALQRHLAGHAARAGRRLAVRIAVQGFDAVCRMVEAGIGVAVVPDVAAARCRRSMAIVPVRLADPWSERRLVVGVRRLAGLTPPARALVEHLRAAAKAA